MNRTNKTFKRSQRIVDIGSMFAGCTIQKVEVNFNGYNINVLAGFVECFWRQILLSNINLMFIFGKVLSLKQFFGRFVWSFFFMLSVSYIQLIASNVQAFYELFDWFSERFMTVGRFYNPIVCNKKTFPMYFFSDINTWYVGKTREQVENHSPIAS